MDELRVTWDVELSGRLLALLRQETRRYTSGESSSVPWETAQSLLASLLYTLRLNGEAPGERGRQLAESDLTEELRRGQTRLRRKMDYARRLWRRLAGSGAAGDSRALGLPEGRDRRYLAAYAGTLLPRIRTAVEQGGWPGIFP